VASSSLKYGLWRRLLPKAPVGAAAVTLAHATITPRRVWNLRRLHQDYAAGAVRVRAKPVKLVLEATNVCNLHCPGCFTGIGENGRIRSAIGMDFYRRILDELGDTLLEIEFYNWGEPLLCKSIYAMVKEASSKGIATRICTNFSVPFDENKAEALVKSGLSSLSVSLDGATQENYEKYRQGGDIELVLRNAKMVIDAKKRLGAATPHTIWSYHVFEHNVDEVEAARAMAAELGFDEQFFSKGLTYGAEWDDDRYRYFPGPYIPIRCNFLWYYAVIHNDGGVAPCCGSFYHEDDLGRMSTGPGQPGAQTFAEIWNNEAFRKVRGLFAARLEDATPSCGGLCDECPQTKTFQGNLRHIAEGKSAESYRSDFSQNDGHNYFHNHRPARDTRKTLKPERARTRAGAKMAET
jgi:MoaA/NifB/PqqE/SkfB family radical SAM enzyme